MKLKQSSGFTMIELMISMVVIVIGLVGMLLANTSLQRTNQTAYERMVATQDAHRVIELMRNTSATGTFPLNVTAVYPNGNTVGGFANLTNEQVHIINARICLNEEDSLRASHSNMKAMVIAAGV